jgi:hypothetical protein
MSCKPSRRPSGTRIEPVEPPGARESSAGDHFHVLWAARRTIRLLDPGSGLARVRLEGLTPLDRAAARHDQLLGVDLVEYFGGDRFRTADRVVVSQLKYSTRAPEKPWTAARLARAASGGGASVARRLAEIFAAHSAQYGRDETLAKLQIRLVSNQPLAGKTQDALAAAKEVLVQSSKQVRYADLARQLRRADKAELDRLYRASGLSSKGFTNFLRLLVLSDTGEDSIQLQSTSLLQELNRHVLRDAAGARNALYQRILEEGLPSAVHSDGLTRVELLSVFGVSSIGDLLPAPPLFPDLDVTIRTADVQDVALAVVGHPRVVAISPAGVGKTTTLRLLEEELPAGSVVLIYDCFGSGDFASPSEARHHPQRALLQLINELAARCGTPLVVEPPTQDFDLWRLFERVLADAASSVSVSGSRLVIAIDAADNAVAGARQRNERSFVPDMWRIRVPGGATLLMTSRRHRLPDLEAPPEAEEVSLVGFDETASAQYLRSVFPSASGEQAKRFHERTRGNPRLQFYALADRRPGETLDALLERTPDTWDTVFEGIIDSALVRVESPQLAEEMLATLMAMTRPVEISRFADAAGVTSSDARRFADGLVPGAEIQADVIALRDENFVLHLQTRVGPDALAAAHARLATYYFSRHQSDAVAAVEVGEQLALAARDDDLIDLALHGGFPDAIPQPLTRLEIFNRRLRLAIAAAVSGGRHAEALELVLLAGDAATSGSAVAALIQEHAELALRFGDVRATIAVYLDNGLAQWRGPLHLRAAAAYARIGDLEAAREQFELGGIEIRNWMRLEAEERRRVSIEAADVAAGAEALYWEGGGEVAAAWLATWRPPRFAIESGLAALRSVARIRGPRLSAELAALSLPDQLLARCLAALWEEGVRGRREDAEAVAERIVRRRRNWRADDAWWGVGLAELLAAHGADSPTIQALLAKFDVEKPSGVSEHPVMWDGLRLPLRRAALLAALEGVPVNEDDLLPSALVEPADQTRTQQTESEDASRYRTAVRAQAWAYEVRAQAIVGTASVPHIRATLARRLESLRERSKRLFPDFDLSFRRWALPALDAATLVRGNAAKLLSELSMAAEVAVGQPSTVLLDMADILLRTARYQALGLRLVERAVEIDSAMGGAAVERRDVLLRASELASTVDLDLAGLFYRRAIDLVEGINDELPRILQTFSEFSAFVAPVASSQQATWLAEALPRLLEQFQPHVSDSGYLPFRETLNATTTLAPAAGFALATRWNDEDRLSVATSLQSVLPASVRAGFLSPDHALKLLVLRGEQEDLVTEAIPLFDELAVLASRSDVVAAASAFSYAIRRDTSLSQRVAAAGAFLSWLEDHDLGQIEEAEELRRLVSFSVSTESDSGVTVWGYRKEDEEHIRRLIDSAQRAKTTEGVARTLDELAEHLASPDDVRDYLDGVAKALPTSQRAPLLEVLTSLPAERPMRRYASVITSVLADTLARWSGLKAVDHWRQSGAPNQFALRNLGILVGSDYSDRQAPLKSLLESGLLDDPVTVLFTGAADAVGEAVSQTMYRLAELLANVLPPGATLVALEAALQARLDLAVAPPQLPATADPVLGDFLWTLFADVDRRVRWRAAHAARAIGSKDTALVAALLNRLHGGDPGGFRDQTLTFYEMSARLWLLLTLARIGADDHQALSSHQPQLKAIARDSAFPHASIREFARRAALQIDPSPDCDLALANQPNACHATRGRRWTATEAANEADEGRLYFDWDTTRYWFSALAEVFAVNTKAIKERAERWIIDVLGFGTNEIRDDPRLRRNERRYEEMSNRQGAIPALEGLHLYLEYHAMLLVAGELADEGVPVAVETWDPVTDPWRDWLSRYLDGSPDYWLADLRDPPPLHPLVYQPLVPLERWRELTERDFEQELELEGESIIVGSSMSIWDSDRHGSSWVASALVTPDTAHALRLALDGYEDAHDYALPVAGSHSSEWGVSEAGFALESWLREARYEWEGLEEHDPLRRIHRSWQVPDESFRLALNLQPDRHGLRLRDRQGRLVSETVAWSDDVGGNRDYIRNRYTDGWRTTVAWEALLEFLGLTERSLIVKVAIQRQIDRRYGKDVEYDRGHFRNYLISADGSIEGLRQRGRARSKDRRTVRRSRTG